MKRTQKGQSNGPSQRQLRVGELFRHRLCEVFARNDVRDLDLDTRTITVTEVSASPDLRNATAFVIPLGGVQQAEVVRKLNKCAPLLRGEMSKGLRLKYVPELTFKADESFDNADHMRRLFDDEKVRGDLADTDAEGENGPPA
ncbi:MAG: 30S ribosome-binding factor RbfA [Parvibaculales bacterium]